MRKRFAVLALVLVMLAAGSVPAFAQGSYPPGTVWNSPFTVQNMGANSAMVYVEYYRLSDGFFIDTATQSFSVLPSRSVIVDPKLNPDPALTAGLYSVVISSDEPVAAIVNEQSAQRELGYTGMAAGGPNVYLPNITKNYTTLVFNTPFYIQNSGSAAVNVTVEFYDMTTGTKIATATKVVNITPGVSKEFDPALFPDGELPTNRQYSVVATAVGGSIVAAVNQIGTTTNMAYSGFADGASTLYCPNVVKGYSGFLTPIVIQNVGTTPAVINVEYYGGTDGVLYPLAGAKNQTIQPNQSFPERPWFAGNIDNNVLPNNKQYSVIVRGQPGDKLVAIVNQNGIPAQRQYAGTAYDAFSMGYQNVYVPLVSKGYESYLVPIVIQNVGTASTTFSVRYFDLDTGNEIVAAGQKNTTLLPGRTTYERPWYGVNAPDSTLPSNKRYSVVIEGAAGAQLAAIFTWVKNLATTDLSSAYEGVGRNP